MASLCGDEDLKRALQAVRDGGDQAVLELDRLLETFPDDARLHFLRGSVLAGLGRAIEAHAALSRSVDIAPDFPIARFQLGFFQLTSGEADAAIATWAPMERIVPAGHYLLRFIEGLRRLIRDDFAGAVDLLRAGMAVNDENPPLNNDMQLIIDRCLPLMAADGSESEDLSSETALILKQFSDRKPH